MLPMKKGSDEDIEMKMKADQLAKMGPAPEMEGMEAETPEAPEKEAQEGDIPSLLVKVRAMLDKIEAMC